MNTRILMTGSALLMIVAGLLLTFLPEEIMTMAAIGNPGNLSLILQVLGALYFSFGVLNWMAKANIIGGIYSRPIAIGNSAHFFIGGMALLKSASQNNIPFLWVAGLVYAILAALFGYVLFTHPGKETSNVL
ncbi:hypothetical protein GZH53_14115 [Flavihumibacter sp. R14]|nr:hypothetical protein [Flavihumibacter soli]